MTNYTPDHLDVVALMKELESEILDGSILSWNANQAIAAALNKASQINTERLLTEVAQLNIQVASLRRDLQRARSVVPKEARHPQWIPVSDPLIYQYEGYELPVWCTKHKRIKVVLYAQYSWSDSFSHWMIPQPPTP